MAGRKVDEKTAEIIGRSSDFEVFVTELLGIRLNRAQRRLVGRLTVGPDRRWPFKTGQVVAANQVGKTLILACIILWACWNKIGVEPVTPGDEEDAKRWISKHYLWIHLGPDQNQAYHALRDIRQIIKNEHLAQGDRGRFPSTLVEETKVEKYYDGLVFWNGAEAHFRNSNEKARAILGYRASGISFDEAAFEDHLKTVVDEVLYMRLIASGGPLLLVSTPNGMNDFFDFVEAVRSEGRQPEDLVWEAGDQWLVWAVIDDNRGYGISAEEIQRMETTIGSATKEQQLRGAFLEPQDAFFNPQDRVLRAFDRSLPEEQAPIPGHQYAEFWDPSIASDPTAVIVLDVTEVPWVGVYHRWYQKPLDITQLLGEMHMVHRYYHGYNEGRNILTSPSRSIMGFDATSLGGAIIKGLLAPVSPKLGVNFAGQAVKLPHLTNLRDLLTSGKLLLPGTGSWIRVRQEVLNYKLKDDKIKQDNVMALMGATIVGHKMNVGMSRAEVDIKARVAPKKRRLRWR